MLSSSIQFSGGLGAAAVHAQTQRDIIQSGGSNGEQIIQDNYGMGDESGIGSFTNFFKGA